MSSWNEWLRDFWKAMLENSVVGLTPHGPRTRRYWLVKMVSALALVALLLVFVYFSLR